MCVCVCVCVCVWVSVCNQIGQTLCVYYIFDPHKPSYDF